MKKAVKYSSTITLLIVAIFFNSGYAQKNITTQTTHSVVSAATFKNNMRKLWEEHVSWTRNVILCIVDELPGKAQAEKRLLQNEDDIGSAFKPYYGEAAGKELTALLYPHITIAAEVVTALKTGNTIVRDEASKRWYANADEISEFLSKVNPKWKLDDMKSMMNNHLRLTTDEAVQRTKKKYDADIVAYDTIHNEILKMADMFADGIAKQFPEKFKAVAIK